MFLLAFFAGACGDDGGGSAADAGDEVDADDTDGAPATTTCGVLAQGNFAIGTPVLFSDSTGAVLGVEFLDVDGAASSDACVPNTMITLQRIPASVIFFFTDLTTIAGVQPGDTVVLGGLTTPLPDRPNTVGINVTTVEPVPSTTPAANGRVGQVGVFCSVGAVGTTTGNFAIPTPNSLCFGTDNNLDVVTYLLGGEGERVAASFAKDVAAVDAGDTPATMGSWLVFAASNPMSSLTMSNFPAYVDDATAQISHFVDGVLFENKTNEGVGAGVPTMVNALPAGFGETTLSQGVVSNAEISGITRQGLLVVAPYSDSTTLDFANALPRVSGMNATAAGSGRVELTWFTDGSLADADVTLLQFAYDRDGGCPTDRWSIYLPGTGETSFVTPILPDIMTDFAPIEGSSLLPVLAGAAESSVVGYSELLTVGGLEEIEAQLQNDLVSGVPGHIEQSGRRTSWQGPRILCEI